MSDLKVVTVTYSAWTKSRELDESCKYALVTDEEHTDKLLWEIEDEYGAYWDELERLLWYIEHLRGREYVSRSIKNARAEGVMESIWETCDALLAGLEDMKGDEKDG